MTVLHPAHERLHADRLTAADIHDRLRIEGEFPGLDAALDIPDHLRLPVLRHKHVRAEYRDVFLMVIAHGVQREQRLIVHVFDVLAAVGDFIDADRLGEAHSRIRELLNRLLYDLYDFPRVPLRREHAAEVVIPEVARGAERRLKLLLQLVRCHHKQRLALFLAIDRLIELEIIDIRGKQEEFLLRILCEQCFCVLIEGKNIRETDLFSLQPILFIERIHPLTLRIRDIAKQDHESALPSLVRRKERDLLYPAEPLLRVHAELDFLHRRAASVAEEGPHLVPVPEVLDTIRILAIHLLPQEVLPCLIVAERRGRESKKRRILVGDLRKPLTNMKFCDHVIKQLLHVSPP